MGQTKEELIVEWAHAKKSNERWVEADERRRKEIAKVFHWFKPRSSSIPSSYSEPEVRLPSWEEIFVEIGKLLSLRDFRDYDGTISSLELRLEELEKKVTLNN